MRLLLLAVVAVAALAACGSSSDGEAPRSCAEVELVVAASDYTSSVVCGAPGCSAGPGTTGLDLGADPQLSGTGQRPFFLARDNDLVFELDPACGTPVSRFSVHDLAPKDPVTGTARPANPHDAAASKSGDVFLPLYNAAKIAVVRRGTIDGSIDLAPYDADGNPQAEAIRIVEVGGVEKAFVALERLDDRDRLRSRQPSQMLRIDVATRTVEAAVDLAGRNPFNVMAELDGALFLSVPGNFDAADEPLAGIERFDTATSATRLLVAEKDLGGSVSEVAVTDACGVAIAAGPQRDVNPTSLVTFDPETGKVFASASAPVLGPTPGYDLQGLAWRGRTLYVGDRRRGADGYVVHVLERDEGRCNLRPATRTIPLPQRPVALRAVR